MADLTLILGINDISSNVVAGTYEVNSEKEYSEWTDADYISHRILKREKVSGSFDLFFLDLTEYESFTSWISEFTDEETGTTSMRVTVNNTSEVHEGSFFLTFETTRNTRAGLGDYIEQFTVEIEEA